jgi:hypothetical protein
MSDVAKLTQAVERLTTICDKLLMLINRNRVACDGPDAHGYQELWADTKKGIEDLQRSLED